MRFREVIYQGSAHYKYKIILKVSPTATDCCKLRPEPCLEFLDFQNIPKQRRKCDSKL